MCWFLGGVSFAVFELNINKVLIIHPILTKLIFICMFQVFMILYKELYYRDIYARVPGGPKPDQRFHSFYNYCDLFNYILSAETPVPLELPDQWLWELIDEFVYQFQSFAQYRYIIISVCFC